MAEILKRLINDEWCKGAAIRATKTFFQTFVATIGTAVMLSQVDWKAVISASVLSFILSIATSLAGIPEEKIKKEEEC